MADTLPNSAWTQADVDRIIHSATIGFITWMEAFQLLLDKILAPLPQWFLDLAAQAFIDGHLTAGQVEQLTGNPPQAEAVPAPQRLLAAWGDLMHTLAITWPKRRKLAAAQLQRTNAAVAHAQRKFARG